MLLLCRLIRDGVRIEEPTLITHQPYMMVAPHGSSISPLLKVALTLISMEEVRAMLDMLQAGHVSLSHSRSCTSLARQMRLKQAEYTAPHKVPLRSKAC